MRPIPVVCALAVAFGLLAPATAAARKGKAKERFFLHITPTVAAEGVSAEIKEKARATLLSLLEDHPRFLIELKGAPDPDRQSERFKKYLARKKLRAFKVHIKITAFEREEAPPKPGKSGKILKVHIALSLLGEGIPDATMALSGDGSSTVAQETGKKISPRDEDFVIDECLKGALATALDDAVKKLDATPRSRPSRR